MNKQIGNLQSNQVVIYKKNEGQDSFVVFNHSAPHGMSIKSIVIIPGLKLYLYGR